ncbi:uncharacterized protein P884DRAFT_257116 [Thermothelomyces heterothallicus CBS 202.75]|uniref:uncharacterized protein n=1 Tax=Thermothelomyces heterothallicus CBS 202.75 TaxID=1149848 RepID=UPI0037442E94
MAPIPTSTAIGVVVAGSLLGVLGILFFAYSVFWRWKRPQTPNSLALSIAPRSSSYMTPTPHSSQPSTFFTKALPASPPLIYEMPTHEDKRYELPTPVNTRHRWPAWI